MGAPIPPHTQEPMAHFMKFPLPTLVVAAWKEFTQAVADFKEIQLPTPVVTTWKEPAATATNFMEFQSPTPMVATWKEPAIEVTDFMKYPKILEIQSQHWVTSFKRFLLLTLKVVT